MEKIYYSLGLMSGTSMDGVDVSIIQTDGKYKYKAILDKYYEYPEKIYKRLTSLRDKIKNSKDLKKHQKLIKYIEKEITIFHAKAVKETLKKTKINIDFIGFHGQTIFHNAEEKITKQLGDGKLLSKLTKKKVVYDFRQNDLNNDGQGAPLTPIFHRSIKSKISRQNKSLIFINIGGISNATCFNDTHFKERMFARDIGPGNCLIDEWIRKNSEYKYDKNGLIAKSGKINSLILNQALGNINYQNIENKYSLDIKNFDISFVRDLCLEDGAATLTNFTAEIIADGLNQLIEENKYKFGNIIFPEIIICGGGRKNKYLIKLLKKKLKFSEFFSIDKYNIDGDFIESQAFAYLAIRSFLKLPITFPETTGCRKPSTGGVIVKNF